jgi:tetraprenyl-beta-curcumene synthase
MSAASRGLRFAQSVAFRLRRSRRQPLLRDVNAVVRAVLLTPTRLRRLLGLGPRGLASMARFLSAVVPRAAHVLASIEAAARMIPDAALREQALASIHEKAYHVAGGCILATFLHRAAAARYVGIVAPLETIYDYLDNLCDRLPNVSPQAYPTLHEALLDALDDRRAPGDYYRDGPAGDDGGYLRGLVARVRAGVAALPNYHAVRAELVEIAAFYAELQTFKHAGPDTREAICTAWYERNRERFPGLYWWEFAAACGSSLPVFALLYLASQTTLGPDAVRHTLRAYFPNVSAVHILLDYFIDQAEDREHCELNFVACYTSSAQAVSRVRRLVAATAARIRTLQDGEWHSFVLRAMCLFYLTHPKVFEQHLDAEGTAVLAAFG